MSKSRKLTVGRRGFLKGAAAGAAALAATPQIAPAQQGSARGNATARPNQTTLALDTGAAPAVSDRVIEHPGSDFMVDVLKTLNLEYCAANPGSTFDGLHESLINYGANPNSMPEFLTCCHEESAVAMAHGYAKTELKPMLAVIH